MLQRVAAFSMLSCLCLVGLSGCGEHKPRYSDGLPVNQPLVDENTLIKKNLDAETASHLDIAGYPGGVKPGNEAALKQTALPTDKKNWRDAQKLGNISSDPKKPWNQTGEERGRK